MATLDRSSYPRGHKAEPRRLTGSPATCAVCGLPLTFIAQTNQPDQWRHPKRPRAHLREVHVNHDVRLYDVAPGGVLHLLCAECGDPIGYRQHKGDLLLFHVG